MLPGRRPVTIEIGPQSVKVAQLSDRRGSVRVVRFAEQELPSGMRWEVGGDRGPVVDAIRQALARGGIRAGSAVISLPRGQVTARVSAFPQVERDELRRVVGGDDLHREKVANHGPAPRIAGVDAEVELPVPVLDHLGHVELRVLDYLGVQYGAAPLLVFYGECQAPRVVVVREVR